LRQARFDYTQLFLDLGLARIGATRAAIPVLGIGFVAFDHVQDAVKPRDGLGVNALSNAISLSAFGPATSDRLLRIPSMPAKKSSRKTG